MAYTINRYNNATLSTEDGTLDQPDSKLVGNHAGYGEIQNENFVFLLENFSGANVKVTSTNVVLQRKS